jgi:hypothetical protein
MVVVFEGGVKFGEEVSVGAKSNSGSGDGSLSVGGGPGEGGAFGHIGQGEGDSFVVVIVDSGVDVKIELYGGDPRDSFLIGSVKGFGGSDTEFSGFQGGHGVRWGVLWETVGEGVGWGCVV